MTVPLASLADYGTHDESARPELWAGCVGAWCPSLGPTGDRLHDFSIRGNWGTLTNMDPATDWVVDGGGYALDFDATDDGVPISGDVPTDGNITVSAWVKRTGVPLNNNSIVCAKGGLQGDSNSTFALYWNVTLGWSWFVVNASNTLAIVRSNTASATGEWIHVCGVASSGGMLLYINGVLANSASGGTAKSSSHTTRLASLTDAVTTYGGNVILDDVRVYSRALTSEEVRTLALRRAIAFEREELPVWYVAEEAASTFTAAITGTMGAMIASLSAGFTKPTFSASITGTHAPMTAALSASRTLPTDTAAIVATHAPMTAALSATFTQPVDTAEITATNAAMTASLAATFATVQFSASIAATNAPMSASVSAAFAKPVDTASVTATLAPMTAALSATFAKPVDTASIAGTLGAMTSTVSATSATEIDTASIIATIGAMTASLTAAFSDVVYVTTECGIVPHFTRSTVPRFRRRNIVASMRRNTVPRFRRARR